MKEMFNHKLLIYVAESALVPTGGASGYNYNLNNGLTEIGATNYEYLQNVDASRNKIKSMKDNQFKKVLFVFLRIANYSRLLLKRKSYSKVDLSKYEIVHFHNVKDMYEARTSLEGYKGRVLITSHSPKPFSLEIYEDVITPFERVVMGWMYKKLYVMERYAFDRADTIIFPCEDAEEPYYKNWQEYSKIHERNKDKYRYLLSGTGKCTAKISGEKYRKDNNISVDDFVISYVGRHNKTKGYDSLKKLGQKLLTMPNVSFLIGGKEFPLVGIDSGRWHEVGWTNDPHSLIGASDLFILPNLETYFDLVMLEVLSLGKIVVASRTGGNKYFEKINAKGIFLYDTEEEAISIVKKIIQMPKADREKLGESNSELFKNNFSNAVFAKSYVDLVNSLE